MSDAEIEVLHRRSNGVTRERMLRELSEAMEVLTDDQALVLVLEDLHWSDHATLDWLSYMVRRRDPFRLLIIGTYRPVEAIVQSHPVRLVTDDLRRHDQGLEMALEYFSIADVLAYLRQRFGERAELSDLAEVLHQRTTGSPLFLATLVDHLVQQGVIEQVSDGWVVRGNLNEVAGDVPDSLRRMLEQQLEMLSVEDQQLLERASVAGVQFSAAALASESGFTTEAIDTQLGGLARRGLFLQTEGITSWPDSTVSGRYRFIHALYQEILYNGLAVSRCIQIHQQIGTRLELSYGSQASELSAELAVHFMRGRDDTRAIHYLQQAGEQAIQRNANQDAIVHFTQALELTSARPETAERDEQELQVLLALGPALMITKGFADPDVMRTYKRATALCQQLDRRLQLFPALWGLWLATGSADVIAAQELGTQLLGLAQQSLDPVHLVQAHHALWSSGLHAGEFVETLAHAEKGMQIYTPSQHQTHLPLRRL